MQQLLVVTLDARQIRAACEQFVAKRIDRDTEIACAEVPADMSVVVRVSKRRIRKSKLTVAERARAGASIIEAAMARDEVK